MALYKYIHYIIIIIIIIIAGGENHQCVFEVSDELFGARCKELVLGLVDCHLTDRSVACDGCSQSQKQSHSANSGVRLQLTVQHDTIRDAILTCARKPT